MIQGTDDQDHGSRDTVRDLMKQVGTKLLETLIEINKLRTHNKKRIEYRYADAYLGIALQNLELARVVMRKRKRSEEPKVEVQSGEGVEPTDCLHPQAKEIIK